MHFILVWHILTPSISSFCKDGEKKKFYCTIFGSLWFIKLFSWLNTNRNKNQFDILFYKYCWNLWIWLLMSAWIWLAVLKLCRYPLPLLFKWDPSGISLFVFFFQTWTEDTAWLTVFALWTLVYSPLTLGSFSLSKVAWANWPISCLG